MSLKKYEAKIKQMGISELGWNCITKKLYDEKDKLRGDQLKEWEKKNWRRKAEFNNSGDVIIPERWIKSMIINACKKGRFKPHFATRKNETYTFYVGSFWIKNIGGAVCKKSKLEEYGRFESGQGKKKTGTKRWVISPIVKKWNGTFEIRDLGARMKIEELREILDYGGLYCGIGEDRKRNFGRFEVVYLKEVK